MKRLKLYEPTDSCIKCGGQCCQRMPGSCLPSDIEKLFKAETIKQSVEAALISGKFAIDWYEGTNKGFYIRPAIVGHYTIYDPAWYGPCIFLTNNGCELSFEYRPYICKALKPKIDEHKNCDIPELKTNEKLFMSRIWKQHCNLSKFEYLYERR